MEIKPDKIKRDQIIQDYNDGEIKIDKTFQVQPKF